MGSTDVPHFSLKLVDVFLGKSFQIRADAQRLTNWTCVCIANAFKLFSWLIKKPRTYDKTVETRKKLLLPFTIFLIASKELQLRYKNLSSTLTIALG